VKLFSFFEAKEQYAIGVKIPEGAFNLSQALEIYQKAKGAKQNVSMPFLQMLVEMGYCSGQVIQNILSEPWVQSKLGQLRLPSGIQYDVPISRPSKILALGRNYQAHAKEMDHDVPGEPLFFSKAPSSLIPHRADIILPHWLDSRVDHEAELALIIGKNGRNIPEDEAVNYIAGYTIVNDITARTMQKEDMKESKPWFRSKSLDTFCPIGPFLIPADQLDDPHKLDIQLSVNGKIRQKSNTSKMVFKIPTIVSNLSRFMTLFAGDIIATGTPEGVSQIQEGDEIEISITGLGTLKNKVVKET
jgi:2-keto-4-pentenoate hydratase/2-oxohepta-3-ene-1,7-dioic acid hydratase in catechol pathway